MSSPTESIDSTVSPNPTSSWFGPIRSGSATRDDDSMIAHPLEPGAQRRDRRRQPSRRSADDHEVVELVGSRAVRGVHREHVSFAPPSRHIGRSPDQPRVFVGAWHRRTSAGCYVAATTSQAVTITTKTRTIASAVTVDRRRAASGSASTSAAASSAGTSRKWLYAPSGDGNGNRGGLEQQGLAPFRSGQFAERVEHDKRHGQPGQRDGAERNGRYPREPNDEFSDTHPTAPTMTRPRDRHRARRHRRPRHSPHRHAPC